MLAITVADGAIATFIDVDNTKCMTTIQLSTGQIGEWQPEGNDESAPAEYDTVLQELLHLLTEDGSAKPLGKQWPSECAARAELIAKRNGLGSILNDSGELGNHSARLIKDLRTTFGDDAALESLCLRSWETVDDMQDDVGAEEDADNAAGDAEAAAEAADGK